MRCEEVGPHITDRLAGTLDADAASRLRGHLESCVHCRSEYAESEETWHALGELHVPEAPSARMRERFAAGLAEPRRSTDGRNPPRLEGRREWTRRFWPGEPLVQMAIAASMLLVGAVAGRALAPRLTPGAEIAEVRAELHDMRQLLTLSLLQQQSASERLRGVSSTAEIDQPGSEVVSALLDTLLHDQNVNVRLAAVDALRRFSDRPDVRLGTKQAVGDRRSPMLQVAVIDFMVETRDPQASVVLRQLAADTAVDASVRGRAQWALDHLSS